MPFNCPKTAWDVAFGNDKKQEHDKEDIIKTLGNVC